MQKTPNKGPSRHLGKHVHKYDKRNNLQVIANQTHQIHKWLENDDSKKNAIKWFLSKSHYYEYTKMYLVKFSIGQYVGHAKKQFLLR